MSVSAALVKELRGRTGAGMMDCKSALVDSDGDIDKAAELLRMKGAASAEKKAGRIAAEGIVCHQISDEGKRGVLVEVNCETDFVARDSSFREFVSTISNEILRKSPANLNELSQLQLDSGESIEDSRSALVGRIGENISVRRFKIIEAQDGNISGYVHSDKIGVLVLIRGGTEQLGHDIAMHVAASNPQAIDESQISTQILERERGIFQSQAEESGKPAEIVEKMVAGKIKKFLKENTLLGQSFIKNPEIIVQNLLDSEGAEVLETIRFEVAEGIEKKNDDFVDEVLAQVEGR
ncbi:MAG: elongation factor Ts [Acidiferrobacteraceae bacterium]|nr:elongation factor Ts [Acidiferrobacteraceae bacterium]